MNHIENPNKIQMSKSISIYNQMKKDITDGKYHSSEKLTEADLAASYSTSRTTIKKVLLMLEKDDLIEFEPYKGAKVKSFDLEEMLASLELRTEIEGFIAEKAAESISEEDIKRMKTLLSQMESCLEKEDYASYSSTNVEFHQVLYDNCNNPFAVQYAKDLKNVISKYRVRVILVRESKEESLRQHTNIYLALRDNDPVAARKAMRLHILGVAEALKKYAYFL